MQARFLKKGDIIKVNDTGTEEVIREVTVVMALSSGNNVEYPASTEIEVVEPEQVPGRDD